MDRIIEKIKEKYELRSLPNSLIKSVLTEYLLKNRIKDFNSEKEMKIIIKDVRAKLRRYTGQYASKSNIKAREKLIKNHQISKLLEQHTSTRERIEDYPLIKKVIEDISPKSILDLGCGLNPLAISSQKSYYYAYDINNNDLEIVKEYFRINKIEGETHHEDIRVVSSFPNTDLCLIFKVLDILGDNKTKITKDLLTKIKSRFLIISFATNTLSGRPMNNPYRNWFERILNSLNYNYEIRRTKQEIFYLINKQSV